ncbi:hypothetical protein LTR02_017731 [Friedmanniomyces endolithicus]|nr:hypothetical protein LTR02_017731 [Friedmanniomyces endolithicus]
MFHSLDSDEAACQYDNLAWADDLRQQLFHTRGAERERVLDAVATDVLARADYNAFRAEILLTDHARWPGETPIWNHIGGLATTADKDSRVHDPRSHRALLVVTKTWGLEIVQRYQWRSLGREILVELALNAAMLSRHLKELETPSQRHQYRIGAFGGNDKVKAEKCPTRKPDIERALKWVECRSSELSTAPQWDESVQYWCLL